MKLMRSIVIILALVISGQLYGQYEENIRRDIQVYNKALLGRDYNKFITYNIQSVVQLGGGAELMKNVAIEKAGLLSDSKTSIVSLRPVWFGQVHNSEGAIHIVVGQEEIMKIAGDDFEKTAYYLAESVDDGKSWAFVDLEPYDKSTLEIFIPGLASGIEIPVADAAINVGD